MYGEIKNFNEFIKKISKNNNFPLIVLLYILQTLPLVAPSTGLKPI